MKPKLHPKLAHLTEQQLQALVAQYYDGVKTSELVIEFGIDARPSELFKLVLDDIQCPYCAVNLWQPLRSKSAGTGPLPRCPKCAHEHTQGTYRRCHCDGCCKRVAEIEAAIVAKKRALAPARLSARTGLGKPEPRSSGPPTHIASPQSPQDRCG